MPQAFYIVFHQGCPGNNVYLNRTQLSYGYIWVFYWLNSVIILCSQKSLFPISQTRLKRMKSQESEEEEKIRTMQTLNENIYPENIYPVNS